MEEGVPLLNIGQIEELTGMVRSIQSDNTRKLEDILAEMVDIEQSSILVLYNMVTEEWVKKQKIIDNLCHFTLTMMSTVQMLWEQQFQQEDKISRADQVIESLSRDLLELGDQNESYKNKCKETESQLNSVVGQKNKIQELYRSYSCGVFPGQGEWEDARDYERKCSACSEFHIQLQEERNMLKQESVKVIEAKEEELVSVLEEKKKLEQDFVNLKEEHELAKMEVELAEIAIKDALIYKASYLSMMSSVHQSVISNQPLKTNNRQAEDSIQQEDGIYPINSHILAYDLLADQQLQIQSHHSNSRTYENQFSNEQLSDFSLIKLSLKQDKKTTHESPFKKKHYGNNSKQDPNDHKFRFIDDSELNQEQLKDIVILQSSIDLTFQSAQSQKQLVQSVQVGYCQSKKARQLLHSEVKQSSGGRRGEGSKKKGCKKLQGNKKREGSKLERVSDASQNGLSKLYNLISSKLVTSRIKIK